MARQRKLRNYLLNARIQLPVTLLVVCIAVGLIAGLGYVWYKQAREASRVIEARGLSAPRNAEECRELCDVADATITEDQFKSVKDDLAAADRTRLILLIGFGFAFTVLLALYGIVATHKVAGPIYKIAMHMKDIKDGRLYPLWGLRKGDQLQDFWEIFRGMHQCLRQRAKGDRELLTHTVFTLEQHLETSDDARLRELLESLKSAQEEKVNLLGPDDTMVGPGSGGA